MKRSLCILLVLITAFAIAFALLSGCSWTRGSVSIPSDWEADPGFLHPFLENGDLIWNASDFKLLHVEHMRERSASLAQVSNVEKKEDIQRFVKILSAMDKALVYTEKLSDSFDKTAGNGILPVGMYDHDDMVYHFGPFLPDRGFLQIYKKTEGSYLYFRLENNGSDLEAYHVSLYSIGLQDFEKLDHFLSGLGLESSPAGLSAKPVLYLYPAYESDIHVKLHFEGSLSVTYPAYENGWHVRAYPDGRLINFSDHQEYSYLFWEGFPWDARWERSEGYCVKGSDTVSFLQETLRALGLTPKEYNEFIVYWLPLMQDNPYNLITFQWDEYERIAQLDISPEPDSILRVFMVFEPLQEPVEIAPPAPRQAFVRQGFSVVEWGGAQCTK